MRVGAPASIFKFVCGPCTPTGTVGPAEKLAPAVPTFDYNPETRHLRLVTAALTARTPRHYTRHPARLITEEKWQQILTTLNLAGLNWTARHSPRTATGKADHHPRVGTRLPYVSAVRNDPMFITNMMAWDEGP